MRAQPYAEQYMLDGLFVRLSAPIQVAKWPNRRQSHISEAMDGTFLWYPQVARLANGDLLAQMRLGGDSWQADLYCPIAFSWSGDDGATWSELTIASRHNGYGSLLLPSGDWLMLPFLLGAAPQGMVGSCTLIHGGTRDIQFIRDAVTVTGFLGDAVPDLTMDIMWQSERPFKVGGFFFDGRPVPTRDGGWVTTLYGKYAGDVEKKCTLHAAASSDGFHWEIRSTIVPADSPVGRHPWSNSEAEICRLADGRLMCVYRIEEEPYGQVFSDDEGFTWSEPTAMPEGVGTVEPRLAVMPAGVVALCGGRPRFYLWFNADGTGEQWQDIDIFTHHNNLARPDQVHFGGYRFDGSSAYGSVIVLDNTHLLCIYDCFTDDEFGIYVIRAEVTNG